MHLACRIIASIIREELAIEGTDEKSDSYAATFMESIIEDRIKVQKLQTLAHTNIRLMSAAMVVSSCCLGIVCSADP